MNFSLSDEQTLLRESVGGYLARHYAFDARRAAAEGAGWRPEIWRAFAEELGLFGAAMPEAVGGFGGGAVETMLICEEFGRSLVLEPYLESIVLGANLLAGYAEQTAALLGGVIDGSAILAPALYEAGGRFNLSRIATRATGGRLTGAKIAVTGAPIATHYLVSATEDDGISLFVVTADAGVERRDYALIDGRLASDLIFADIPATRIGAPGCALGGIERAVDAAIAGLCAEAVGVMETMLSLTVDYAKQRRQFGVAIATFQVLQHRMVDMMINIERARSLAVMATMSIDLPDRERAKAVSAAKAFVSKALKQVGEAAIQLHGGIGTTEDIAVSHYFKRATVMQSQFGTASFHLDRMAHADPIRIPPDV